MTSSRQPDFSPCHLCQQRFGEQAEETCPMLPNPPANGSEMVQHLLHETAFAEWLTPQEVASRFNYSPRHVLRMVKSKRNKIICHVIDNRWFIMRCSFEEYLNRHNGNTGG